MLVGVRPAAGQGLDTVSLGSLVDSVMEAGLAQLRIPGAVITIVASGRVVLARGYGLADLENGTPMDPGSTILRVGSISKPVTATAVMQLVERGGVRLDADINDYFGKPLIPPAFDRPITVAHLLTHTAGLDVRLSGSAARSEDRVMPLATYLAADLPPRIRPPGQVLAYSNHGYAVLGHVVEVTSGVDFETYVQERVFRPLGMVASSFRFTPDVAARAATGYEPHLPRYRRAVVVHPNIVPAASLNTTAADMARFMIAHLEGGAVGPVRILADSTVAVMHRQQFVQDARVPGITYGFFESFENGTRTLFHVGGIRGFMAGMYLWPEQRLGMFVANNGYHPDLVRDVAIALVDHLFPSGPRPPRSPAVEPATRHAGTYRLAAHASRNLEKAGALRRRGNELVVRDAGGGRLAAFGEVFEPVAPGLFRMVNGDETLAFPVDRAGSRRLVTTDLFYAVQVWERVPWYQQGRWSQRFLLLAVLAFLSAVVRPPGRRVDWTRLGSLPAERGTLRWARWTLTAVTSLFLVSLAGLATTLRVAGPTGLLFGVPPLLGGALMVGTLGAILALSLPAWAVAIWRNPQWPVGSRLHYSAVALMAFLFAGFLAYWRLVRLPG